MRQQNPKQFLCANSERLTSIPSKIDFISILKILYQPISHLATIPPFRLGGGNLSYRGGFQLTFLMPDRSPKSGGCHRPLLLRIYSNERVFQFEFQRLVFRCSSIELFGRRNRHSFSCGNVLAHSVTSTMTTRR